MGISRESSEGDIDVRFAPIIFSEGCFGIAWPSSQMVNGDAPATVESIDVVAASYLRDGFAIVSPSVLDGSLSELPLLLGWRSVLSTNGELKIFSPEGTVALLAPFAGDVLIREACEELGTQHGWIVALVGSFPSLDPDDPWETLEEAASKGNLVGARVPLLDPWFRRFIP